MVVGDELGRKRSKFHTFSIIFYFARNKSAGSAATTNTPNFISSALLIANRVVSRPTTSATNVPPSVPFGKHVVPW